MQRVLHNLRIALINFRRSLSAIACIFYAAGREALLRRVEARTELEELAVKEKRLKIQAQHANSMIDVVQRIEKIKDAQLREKVRAAILTSLPTVQDASPAPPPCSGFPVDAEYEISVDMQSGTAGEVSGRGRNHGCAKRA
jgi:hypothetical protein